MHDASSRFHKSSIVQKCNDSIGQGRPPTSSSLDPKQVRWRVVAEAKKIHIAVESFGYFW